MPDITAVGTYTKDAPGFEFLQGSKGRCNDYITLLFAGSTLPTTLEVKYTDDEGNDQVFEGGTVTALPASLTIENVTRPVKIVVTGGTPNFNVTSG